MKRVMFAAAALAAWALVVSAGPVAAAEKKIDAKADKYLRAMSDYLAGLKTFSFRADEAFDVVGDDGQKLQYSNRRDVIVRRPNGLKSVYFGDTAGGREFFYDGKSIALFDKSKNAYGTDKAPGTIHAMLDLVHERTGQSQPLADFLFPDPYKVLTEHVQSGRYVGLHNLGAVKCHHLAFRQKGIDWQIWIQDGDKPLPRKLVITYKREAGGPQYAARLNRWDENPKLKGDPFAFKAPDGARKVDIAALVAGGKSEKESGEK